MNPSWANRPYRANLPYINALPGTTERTGIPGGIYRGRLARLGRLARALCAPLWAGECRDWRGNDTARQGREGQVTDE